MRGMRAGLLVCLLFAGIAHAQVTIKHNPPKVKTRVFNPEKPPAEMPRLNRDEAAVTESKFACGVQVEVQVSQQGNAKPVMKVTGVKADLTLEIVIWLPNNVTNKIRRHEDGHREISEHYYKDAEAIARKFASSYIGKQLDIKSTDRKETQAAIHKVANEFCGHYLGATEVPGEKAQLKYDDLTDHGRNNVPEKEAIQRSLAEK